jgi:hypothetical protein
MQYADAMQMRTYLVGRNEWLMGGSQTHSSSTGPAGYASSSTGAAGPGCSGPSSPVTPSGPAPIVFTDFTQPLVVSFPATSYILPSEKASLETIVRNLQRDGSVDDSRLIRPGTDSWTSLRGWSDLTLHTHLDPCVHRVVGLTCENGRVTGIWMFGAGGPTFTGPVDPEWGSFEKMRMLELGNNNLQGAVPQAICNATSLLMLGLESQTDGVRANVQQGLTSLPECIGDLPMLIFTANANLLTNLPATLSSARGLQFLIMDHNKLAALPAGFTQNLQGLLQINLAFNPTLIVPLPSFNGWSNLTQLDANNCGFFGPIPTGALDGLANVVGMNLAVNQLSGPLPMMVGAASLVTITLDHNSFDGGIPLSWQLLSKVTTIRLHSNRLSGPMAPLGQMLAAQSIWLQDNLIYTPTKNGITDGGLLISQMSGTNLQELILDNNNITGIWTGGRWEGTRMAVYPRAFDHRRLHFALMSPIPSLSRSACPSSQLQDSLPREQRPRKPPNRYVVDLRPIVDAHQQQAGRLPPAESAHLQHLRGFDWQPGSAELAPPGLDGPDE